MSTYKVVFWGGIQPEQDKNQVIRRFAERFKLTDRKQLQNLFCGRIITLRKGLDHAKARQLASALEGIGALCRVEPENNQFWGVAANQTNRYPSGLTIKKAEAARRAPLVVNNKAVVAA